MNIYKIENEHFVVKVKDMGAELTSMFCNEFNHEYIWQGDETFPRQANNLFPNCGGIVGGEIKIDGKSYAAKQHGFARDMTFTLVEINKTYLSLVLKSNDKTRLVYPYEFELYINFELIDDKLKQTYKIVNKSKCEMPFGVGAHTGFALPLSDEDVAETDYVLDFGKNKLEYLPQKAGTPFILGTKEEFTTTKGRLSLSDETFANGSFILDGFKYKKIKLFGKNSNRYVMVEFHEFENCVIWCKEGKLKYVCIEPWNGLPDVVDSDQNFSKKLGNKILGKDETFSCCQYFSVG